MILDGIGERKDVKQRKQVMKGHKIGKINIGRHPELRERENKREKKKGGRKWT